MHRYTEDTTGRTHKKQVCKEFQVKYIFPYFYPSLRYKKQASAHRWFALFIPCLQLCELYSWRENNLLDFISLPRANCFQTHSFLISEMFELSVKPVSENHIVVVIANFQTNLFVLAIVHWLHCRHIPVAVAQIMWAFLSHFVNGNCSHFSWIYPKKNEKITSTNQSTKPQLPWSSWKLGAREREKERDDKFGLTICALRRCVCTPAKELFPLSEHLLSSDAKLRSSKVALT